jgi:quercetin dioxygenase-like cupin family protein
MLPHNPATRRGLTLLACSLVLMLVACERTDTRTDTTPADVPVPVSQTTFADHDHDDDHILYRPAEIEWRNGPVSLEAGAEFAVLEGNPSEPGIFTMRIKMPDGFYIAPHFHPQYERVTVVSGAFLLGSGEMLDPDATMRLDPGSYTSMPPGMRHFAFADGETVIQLTSEGPWEITYVDEDDDPRLRN